MTRQAAPPARRWLLVILALLVGPWLGQGAAVAYSVSVNPQSGPAGTTVSVVLSEFGAGCIVYFDGEPVAGARDCEGPTTLVFDVPPTSVGNHTILAEGIVIEGAAPSQSFTFRVTATPATTAPAPTAAPITSPSVSTVTNDIAVGQVGSPTTVARTGTSLSTASTTPTTTGPPTTASTTGALTGASSGSGPVFGAACPPRQVALKRFSVAPARGRPGAKVSGTTSYGRVGTCTEIRDLRVILDGKTVPGELPPAGTSGTFEMTIPRDAEAGAHTLALVADEDPSVALASLAFQVDKAAPSILPVVAIVAAGAALFLAVLLLARRRRRRRRARAREPRPKRPPEESWSDVGDGDGWGGTLDVPDIAEGPDSLDDPPAAPVIVVEDHPTMPVVPLVVAGGRHGSFYLLERQNPHAPRQANGKRGWYRVGRSQPIRRIVVDTVEPHTAGAAASELAIGGTPASAHVLVDVDGALDLLPDDVVAVHRAEHDEAALVMLLAGVGTDLATDDAIFGHATRWANAKMREHAIPARLLTGTEFEAGEAGLLSGETTFLWHRILTLAEPPPAVVDDASVAAPPPDETPFDEAPFEEAPVDKAPFDDTATFEARFEEAPVDDTATFESAGPFEAAGAAIPVETDATLDTATSAEAPGPFEAAGPLAAPEPPPVAAPAAAVEPSPPPTNGAPAAPPPRRPRHPLPTPDELIAQVSAEPRYFLVDHENHHATLRANGKHGWYYPTRYGGIRAVVLHTLPGDTADAVAAHLAAVDQPEAAHAVVDPDAIVELLPDEATALHGVRSSSAAIDLALAYDPSAWGTDPAREEALLVRAATWAGVRAVRHGVPVRRITVDQWHAGQGGIAANGDVDPGPDFPWERFLQLTAWVAGRVASGAMSSS